MKYHLLLVAMFIMALSAKSQTLEEYQRKEKERFAKYKKKRIKEFKDFKDKRDKEFLEFVKTGWIKLKPKKTRSKKVIAPKPLKQPTFVPIVSIKDKSPEVLKRRKEKSLPKEPEVVKADKKPKAEIPPKSEKRPLKEKPVEEEIRKQIEISKITPLVAITSVKNNKPTQKPLVIAKRKIPARKFRDRDIRFKFYGSDVAIPYNKSVKIKLKGIKEADVATYWYDLSNSEYETMFNDIADVVEDMNLNDWAYYLLLKKIASKVYKRSQLNEQNVFILFFLNKSGFKAKIARVNDKLELILPFKNTLYSTTYVNINDKKYYFVKKIPRSSLIYTYKKDYPDTERDLDLNIPSSIHFEDNLKKRDLSFKYKGNEEKVSVPYNQNNINFYKDIPASDLQIYFNASIAEKTGKSLLKQLKKKVKGMSEQDAANYLLHFVQKSFDYKTDGDQFGFEKSFFADELFHYSYSDCEDRSVLYAYLVRNILGLKVVGVDFPGHVATAVHFSQKVNGTVIKFDNKDYTICDPTYINANIGMMMPKFANAEIKVIEIK